MDRLETADILAVLKAAYPQFYNGLSPKEANKIVDLWAEMFKDEPVMVVAVAVKPQSPHGQTRFHRTSAKSKSKSRRCVCRRK